VEQAENRVSGTEDRVEDLDQTVKDHEKNAKKIQMEHTRYLRHHEKIKPMKQGYRRREDRRETKGIDNLYNRIIAENFPNLKKESRCRKLIEHQTIRTKRGTPTDIS
jgi:hypothetical protein